MFLLFQKYKKMFKFFRRIFPYRFTHGSFAHLAFLCALLFFSIFVFGKTANASNFSLGGNIGMNGNFMLRSLCGTSFFKVYDGEGNAYTTVRINNQCWLATNMITTKYPNGSSITRGATTATWDGNDNAYYAYPGNTSDTAEESLANILSNNLGFVYQWSAVMNGSTAPGAQGICPNGWHVPTDTEQWNLENYLKDAGQTCDPMRTGGTGDCSTAGTKLKSGGSSGFNAPPTGHRTGVGGFGYRTTNTMHFSSTNPIGSTILYRTTLTSQSYVRRNTGVPTSAYTVRCLAGVTPTTTPVCGDQGYTVQDADGNSYGTILVNGECWMQSNLRVGTRVDVAGTLTNNGVREKYCRSDSEPNCVTYGGYYTWGEAMQYSTSENAQGLCPSGWHVPTDAEWYGFENYLQNSTCSSSRVNAWDCSTAGTKLRASTDYPYFYGRTTGYYNWGSFFDSSYTYYWTSTQYSGNYAYIRGLYTSNTGVYRDYWSGPDVALSLRCVKN
jgi:uncharacterized protein (TIGR02145 family)